MTHVLSSLPINTKESNAMDEDSNMYLSDTGSSASSSPDSYSIEKNYSAFRDDESSLSSSESSSGNSSDDESLSPAYGVCVN